MPSLTLKLLEIERGRPYHKTAHDEFLPSFECLEIIRTNSSWETGECLREGRVSSRWYD